MDYVGAGKWRYCSRGLERSLRRPGRRILGWCYLHERCSLLTVNHSRLAKEDAEKLTIPFICLFSKEDGTPELMKEYWEALEKSSENVVEKYGSMHHGWMGARANLEDKDNLKEFERG